MDFNTWVCLKRRLEDQGQPRCDRVGCLSIAPHLLQDMASPTWRVRSCSADLASMLEVYSVGAEWSTIRQVIRGAGDACGEGT